MAPEQDVGSKPEGLDLTVLYREQAAFIGRCIRRLCGDANKVEDLLHETFIVAIKKRHRFDPDRGTPSAWLYGIAANVCRTHLRGERRFLRFKRVMATEPVAAQVERPDLSAERREQAEQVHRAMNKLPFRQREVFSLYELEGLEGKDIARLLKIPINTVWTRLHHARRRFAEVLGKKLPGGSKA